eukprot:9065052-Alexandrium_andersonii.AAC.1
MSDRRTGKEMVEPHNTTVGGKRISRGFEPSALGRDLLPPIRAGADLLTPDMKIAFGRWKVLKES